MIIKAHGMSNQLHTIIETTVSLDVDVLIILIGDREYFISVIAVFSCTVNLQLNSKIPLRIAVEYRLRLVAVVMYRTISVNLFVVAFTAVVVSVKVVGIIFMQ